MLAPGEEADRALTSGMVDASMVVGSAAGANARLSTLLAELEVVRRFTRSIVRGLDGAGLAAVPEVGKNSIGALLSHLVAAESLMRRITTGGEAFPAGTEEEQRVFSFAVDPLAGSDLDAYLERLDESRDATRAVFAARDDAWLDTPRTFFGNPANYHYYWFHYLLDEGRHQGQIILLRKYLVPGADAAFDPYAGLAA